MLVGGRTPSLYLYIFIPYCLWQCTQHFYKCQGEVIKRQLKIDKNFLRKSMKGFHSPPTFIFQKTDKGFYKDTILFLFWHWSYLIQWFVHLQGSRGKKWCIQLCSPLPSMVPGTQNTLGVVELNWRPMAAMGSLSGNWMRSKWPGFCIQSVLFGSDFSASWKFQHPPALSPQPCSPQPSLAAQHYFWKLSCIKRITGRGWGVGSPPPTVILWTLQGHQ